MMRQKKLERKQRAVLAKRAVGRGGGDRRWKAEFLMQVIPTA